MPSSSFDLTINPYITLGVSIGASDTEITKKYRKLALKLHPDKQKPGLPETEKEEIAKRFQDIQQARTFLLDHREERQKYDAKRESDRIRKQADLQREQHMSKQRKRMRDELKQKEKEAAAASRKREKTESLSKAKNDNISQLRRDGQKIRQAYAERDLENEILRQQTQELRQQKQQQKKSLEHRQVRIKWDRKKISTSPSEDSIAALLTQFGRVEGVEFLGSKGNQVLVTFKSAESCRPCVHFYLYSKEMRAKFVGSRKEEEEQRNEPDQSINKLRRDTESLNDRRLRQRGEREELLRQMEQEEESGDQIPQRKTQASSSKKKAMLFPLSFPTSAMKSDSNHYLTELEKYETKILSSLLSKEKLAAIKVIR
jgi:curved DNA-binding protein CbpA